MRFWGHPALQPLASRGMMTSSDGVSAWVMSISLAAAWLVVSQQHSIMALTSSEAGAGPVGADGI